MPKIPFPLKIDSEILEWIRQQASKENRSTNNWIETKMLELKQQQETYQQIHTTDGDTISVKV